MIDRIFSALPFLVGLVCGTTLGIAVAGVMHAAADAREQMSLHVHKNYTVQKGSNL